MAQVRAARVPRAHAGRGGGVDRQLVDRPGNVHDALIGVAIFLALDPYMRPSEVMALKKKQVVPPHAGEGRWAVIIAPAGGGPPSKTGTFDDTITVTAGKHKRGVVAALLRVVYQYAEGPESLLFKGLASRHINAALKRAASALKFPMTFTGHQLRHGGASDDALEGKHIKDIQKRGRWRAPESVRRYEKFGVLLRVRQRFTVLQLQAAGTIQKTMPARLHQALVSRRPGGSPGAAKRARH